MKKGIITGTIFLVIGIGAYIAYRVLSSRQLSPAQTITQSYQGLDITLVYCRPSKKGRLIFGEAKDGALVPYGQYWRMGANDATEITFSKDVNFSDKLLRAGRYRMYAVPNELTWTISFNSELGKWGFDPPNYSLDVLKIDVPVETLQTATEQFSIKFKNDSTGVIMNVDWDKTRLSVPIRLQ